MFRFIALLLLLIALALAARDGYASYQAQALRIMDAGTLWAGLHRDSLQLAEPAISRYLHPFLWHPVMVTILLFPSWLVFGVLGIILWSLTRLPGRRASRDLFMRN
ncbi:MAG: hypothetical protein ABJF07_04235 [Nisaea sp.]|uniref:hypothetical protein n=1 Tax=Nisaea sp. TaxID=2024842 RepID=UPI003265A945